MLEMKSMELFSRFALIVGMMPTEKTSKFYFLSFCNCLIQVIAMVYYLLSNLLVIISPATTLEDRFASAQYISSSVHLCARHWYFLYIHQKALRYLSKINCVWTLASKSPEYKEILKRENKASNIFLIGLVFVFNLVSPGSVIIHFRNIISNGGQFTLPYAYWAPFAKNHYWLSVFIQCYSFQLMLTSVAVSMAFSRIVVLQIKALMEINRRMLENRQPGDEGSHRESYFLYTEIRRLVNEYNDFWSWLLGLEMMFSSFQIAFRCTANISVLKEFDIRIFQSILMISLTCLAPYFVCSNGSIISEGHEEIYRAAYHNLWYKEDVKSRKDLLNFLTATSIPLNIHYKRFVFSKSQYTKLLQVTYSYVTMILHFADSAIEI